MAAEVLAIDGLAGRAHGLARFAADVVPGVDDAGVWFAHDRAVRFQAAGRLAARLDELQVELEEGPCRDAFGNNEPVVADLHADPRWPRLRERQPPARFAASLPMRVAEEFVGTLTVFARARPLDARAMEAADALREAGRYALRDAARAEGLLNEREHLQRALARRDLIGQAKGVLMAQHGLTSDDAFQILVERSQALNRKVYDIADEVATTGALPFPDGHPPRREA